MLYCLELELLISTHLFACTNLSRTYRAKLPRAEPLTP